MLERISSELYVKRSNNTSDLGTVRSLANMRSREEENLRAMMYAKSGF